MGATQQTRIYFGVERSIEKTAAKFVYNACIDAGLEGFTIYKGVGVWKGNPERAIIIEVIELPEDTVKLDLALAELANTLRHNWSFPQEAIYTVTTLVDLVVI